MDRVLYQPTQKQLEKWALADASQPGMPTDEWFKERWEKDHHGKQSGWGMGKKNWIVGQMKNTSEYQRGIWQGRVDCATGYGYAEERSESAYNLGYFRGYTEFESRGTGGWDSAQAQEFKSTYCKQEQTA